MLAQYNRYFDDPLNGGVNGSLWVFLKYSSVHIDDCPSVPFLILWNRYSRTAGYCACIRRRWWSASMSARNFPNVIEDSSISRFRLFRKLEKFLRSWLLKIRKNDSSIVEKVNFFLDIFQFFKNMQHFALCVYQMKNYTSFHHANSAESKRPC